MTQKYDLQDRLIKFSVNIIDLTEKLPSNPAGKHISNQLLRSGTSPAANYGEAQAAESRADFIHKMKISLKELRETDIWLKIVERKEYISNIEVDCIIQETNELISIFYKSIKTAKENQYLNK